MKLVLSQQEVENRARDLYARLKFGNRQVLRIYGVPRGGVPVTYMLLAISNELSLGGIVIVETPTDADYIVDDLVDSGKTKEYFNILYPTTPFLVLLDKKVENIKDWIVFPWENAITVEKSGTDIPLRLLQFIGEDTDRGGLQETPKRFLKAWEHYTSGYDKDPQSVLKEFEDGAEQYNEMVLVKDIPVFSHCEHHLAPFYGVAHVAYIPDGKIVGLSKLARLVDIFMRRLQVQERLTSQIADTLEEVLSPLGVAVVLDCAHTCMIARGVQVAGSTTITSTMKGAFRTQPETRAEFMGLIK